MPHGPPALSMPATSLGHCSCWNNAASYRCAPSRASSAGPFALFAPVASPPLSFSHPGKCYSGVFLTRSRLAPSFFSLSLASQLFFPQQSRDQVALYLRFSYCFFFRPECCVRSNSKNLHVNKNTKKHLWFVKISKVKLLPCVSRSVEMTLGVEFLCFLGRREPCWSAFG